MHNTLGTDEAWEVLESDEFDESQIAELKKRFDTDIKIPEWLPKTPLLIWYYINWMRNGEYTPEYERTPELGWLHLMEKFCQREIKQIDTLPLVPEDLYDLYGELANTARKRESNIGPISLNDMINAYRYLFKDEPTGVSLGQLMRLPGLIEYSGAKNVEAPRGNLEDGFAISQKKFLNSDFVDVAAARYLVKYFQTANSDYVRNQVGIKHVIGDAGIACAAYLVNKFELSDNVINSSIYEMNKFNSSIVSQLDCLNIVNYLGFGYNKGSISIKDIYIDDVDFGDPIVDYSRICIRDSYISNLYISVNYTINTMPTFVNCCVENLYLDASEDSKLSASVESKIMDSCDVDDRHYQKYSSSSYQSLEIGRETKIVCTILQKTYLQSRKGRLESAVYSGISNDDTTVVTDMLGELERVGYLTKERVRGGFRWRPVKSRWNLVSEFMSNPTDKNLRKMLEFRG